VSNNPIAWPNGEPKGVRDACDQKQEAASGGTTGGGK
jgi:hypothetical protein